MLALLLAAAAPASAIEAERAFAADAKTLGQWTAFRKWAAVDAVMFAPQPVRAQDWLKERTEPATSVAWEPTGAWRSCDGALAVTTGYWYQPDKGGGWFTTVWKRQADGGWRWVLNNRDTLTKQSLGNRWFEHLSLDCRRKPPKLSPAPSHGYEQPTIGGQSPDGTLRYAATITPMPPTREDPRTWTRDVNVELWDGRGWSRVLSETVAE